MKMHGETIKIRVLLSALRPFRSAARQARNTNHIQWDVGVFRHLFRIYVCSCTSHVSLRYAIHTTIVNL